MSTTRRPTPLKWHPPPPPTPRIIHFLRRHRRKIPPKNPLRTKKLEALFDEERSFFKNDLPIVLLQSSESGCERRERVVEEERERCDFGEEGETERVVELEMLRAECRALRMERDVVLKKMENDRVRMEKMICSAVHTLHSARKKIFEQRRGGVVALEEEIDDLAEKLLKLHWGSQDKDFELRSCSNFDKQVSVLQGRLKSLGGLSDQKCVKEVGEIAQASLSIDTSCKDDESRTKCSKSIDMEVLKMKMERLSKGMLLEKMEEEYGSLLSTANSSVTSSASTSKRMEYPDSCSTSSLQFSQEVMLQEEVKTACSGRCKAIVRRIVAQVRAETEQWSQMQAMLEQVKAEMEELQASRDFWEDQAIDSGFHIQSLHSSVQEWEQKAIASEDKAGELYAQLYMLQAEIQRTRLDQHKRVSRTKPPPPISLDEQIEKEKRVLICRLKENHHTSSSKQQHEERRKARVLSTHVSPEWSPFRDIGNSSPLVRQINRAVSSLHCS